MNISETHLYSRKCFDKVLGGIETCRTGTNYCYLGHHSSGAGGSIQ